jgi:lycopene cyclase domain-containing protein
LIPFFIVNGILTGSGLKQPVVWYNNAENIGIRLFTIPVEDIAYGLELILANIFFFEIFKKDYRVPLRGR